MPREYPGSLSVAALEFSQGLQRVSQFADERSSSVRLKIDKQQLRLSSSSPESGESEETLDATCAGDPTLIAFNARYLLDFTKAASAERLIFHFKGPDVAAEGQLRMARFAQRALGLAEVKRGLCLTAPRLSPNDDFKKPEPRTPP